MNYIQRFFCRLLGIDSRFTHLWREFSSLDLDVNGDFGLKEHDRLLHAKLERIENRVMQELISLEQHLGLQRFTVEVPDASYIPERPPTHTEVRFIKIANTIERSKANKNN